MQMVDIRACEQCGTEFTPRREHARFCSAGCRMAWNRGDPRQATVSFAALDWSVNAMTEVTSRLEDNGHKLGLLVTAATAVSDATWWVTLVDATLVRYQPGEYDATLESLRPAEREEIEQTLAGLRYVRNQMGLHIDPVDFLQARPATPGIGSLAPGTLAPGELTWTWSVLPAPVIRDLTPRGQEWEYSRYQAYRCWLAGRPVSRAFTLAAGFLQQAAAIPSPESTLTA
jgi:hypothetical protein